MYHIYLPITSHFGTDSTNITLCIALHANVPQQNKQTQNHMVMYTHVTQNQKHFNPK